MYMCVCMCVCVRVCVQVNHQWQVPPQHSKFQDPSAQVERTAGVTGASLRKVALPANQGTHSNSTPWYTYAHAICAQ